LQIAFIRRRGRTDTAARVEVAAILEEEIELAVALHAIARRDARIGFEATNHYVYTLQDLREKVLNCEALRARWNVRPEGGSEGTPDKDLGILVD
jgi:hypothetical protein